MELRYLRQSTVDDAFYSADSDLGRRKSTKKFSKKKFSILLSGNLIVWLIFAVSFFDLKVLSMPSLPSSVKLGSLTVTGIVYNEASPAAIISNEVFQEGDQVNGYTILSISRDSVKFQKGDKTITRKLH